MTELIARGALLVMPGVRPRRSVNSGLGYSGGRTLWAHLDPPTMAWRTHSGDEERRSPTMTMAEKNAEAKVDVKPEATAALEKREERRPRRWDPFEMFDDLHEDMARLWGQAVPLMPRPVSRPLRRMALAPTTWTPSVDVYEKDGNLVVKAELPGLKREDIEVALDQGDLLIRG